jgi:hypothetical protein
VVRKDKGQVAFQDLRNVRKQGSVISSRGEHLSSWNYKLKSPMMGVCLTSKEKEDLAWWHTLIISGG